MKISSISRSITSSEKYTLSLLVSLVDRRCLGHHAVAQLQRIVGEFPVARVVVGPCRLLSGEGGTVNLDPTRAE